MAGGGRGQIRSVDKERAGQVCGYLAWGSVGGGDGALGTAKTR